jgi:hypothetical protein
MDRIANYKNAIKLTNNARINRELAHLKDNNYEIEVKNNIVFIKGHDIVFSICKYDRYPFVPPIFTIEKNSDGKKFKEEVTGNEIWYVAPFVNNNPSIHCIVNSQGQIPDFIINSDGEISIVLIWHPHKILYDAIIVFVEGLERKVPY